MDVAFVSEFTRGQRIFRFVDASDGESIVRVGSADPVEESYCQRVVDGRLPEVIGDATTNAEALSLPATKALPVGAHLSVPITLSDGSVFGTLCCFKSEADESLSDRDGAVMHLFASLAAGYLEGVPAGLSNPDGPSAVRTPAEVRDLGDVDGQLRHVQQLGWPALAALGLCTALYGFEHLSHRHLLGDNLEEGIAALGVVALVSLVLIGFRWRALSRGLGRESAELGERRAIERAEQTAFDIRRGRIEDVLGARDSLHMVFQPIFDLADGRLLGHEALARFAGERTPDVWFAEAHDVGLGVELELLAVTEAIRNFDEPTGYLSVNVSPDTLRSPALQSFLRRSPDANRIVLELTEHAVIDDYEIVAGCIAQVSQFGARLAVDDAGSGFASMRHIIDLAPDIVKLDRSIIDHVDCDPAREALVRSLAQFAVGIGAVVVAEGLEREEEASMCRALGVDAGQGFLLARPAARPHRGSRP
jgi:EAL domain-containing protein (putative c-di-GMP-specific phosphodiesterase class I)